MMCPNTVECVKMQCTREYIGDEREARATDLCKMTIDERKNIPLKTYCVKGFWYLAFKGIAILCKENTLGRS